MMELKVAYSSFLNVWFTLRASPSEAAPLSSMELFQRLLNRVLQS